MKISFVIPAYNEEECLGKCLDSVFRRIKEENRDAEVIVVNNASTDRTKEIAESFKGAKVVDEKKKGLIPARQAGFKASKGELIANIDADTILPSGWIKKACEEFSKDGNMVALSGPFIYYDLPRAANVLTKVFFSLGLANNILARHVFHRGSVIQGGNFVLRRSALEKIGGYNAELNFFGEDIDVAKRISKVGKVKFSLNFPIYTSGRRLKAEGVFKTAASATADYFWVTFTGKPYRKGKQADIRMKK